MSSYEATIILCAYALASILFALTRLTAIEFMVIQYAFQTSLHV